MIFESFFSPCQIQACLTDYNISRCLDRTRKCLCLYPIGYAFIFLTYKMGGDIISLLIKEAMTEKAYITALSESLTFGVSRAGKDIAATPPEQVSEQESVGAPG